MSRVCARVRVGRLGLRWKSTSVNSSMLPPPPAPPIPPGFILVDRHIEKNAGSTFRELLFQAEKRGLCMYWGYQQRSIAWTAFLEAMEPNNMTASRLAAWVPPRVCMEAHSHIDYGIPWLKRLEQLRVLRSKLRHSPALRTSIVMLLRLRQPLRLYVSFYLWTVAERQARNPERFGRTFADWARSIPNLQTELLLSSKSAFAASFAPIGHGDLSVARRCRRIRHAVGGATWRTASSRPLMSSARPNAMPSPRCLSVAGSIGQCLTLHPLLTVLTWRRSRLRRACDAARVRRPLLSACGGAATRCVRPIRSAAVSTPASAQT